MYDARTRREATALRAAGLSWSEISRRTGVSRSTLRDWAGGPIEPLVGGCPRCDLASIDASAYAALLGFYLGDGCLSRAARYWTLRIACDARQPGIVADLATTITTLRPQQRVYQLARPGCVMVTAHWVHWQCLFPQHGPGRKHERPITLEPWQEDVVRSRPDAFLRGLFHSDGCRVRNWTTQVVAGETKRYDYPRWQFTNVSADIRELCCWALDLVEIPWRQSSWNCISVSRREAVARLDELIGMKE